MENDHKNNISNILCVCTEDPTWEAQAAELAEHLQVRSYLCSPDDIPEDERTALTLRLDGEGLTLTDGKLELRGDFREMLPRLRSSNMQQEMLVKAARMKGQVEQGMAVDATAGMGDDSLILAASGFQVWCCEQNPVIAALLKDSIQRARKIPELADAASRMHLVEGNSIEIMKQLKFRPNVILLDPMFPARQKSAQVKKKFQLLHNLEMPCNQEEELLEAAIRANPRKIVIKRPVKGPYLAGRKPGHSYSGKAIRYDCMVFA